MFKKRKKYFLSKKKKEKNKGYVSVFLITFESTSTAAMSSLLLKYSEDFPA